jgi:hypothetical protein
MGNYLYTLFFHDYYTIVELVRYNNELHNKIIILEEDNIILIKTKNINQIDIETYKYTINNYIQRIDILETLIKEYNIDEPKYKTL